MKKYLFILSFLFSLFFSSQSVPQAYAERQEGDLCGCAIGGANEGPNCPGQAIDYLCAPGLFCKKDDPNKSCFFNSLTTGCAQNHCRKRPAEDFIDCTCDKEYISGRGINSMTCDNKKVFCKGQSNVCAPKAGALIERASINFNGQEIASGKLLRGVECKPYNPTATCHCLGNGQDKNNNFECALDSDKTKTGTAFCGSAQDICIKASDQAFNIDAFNRGYSTTGILAPSYGYLFVGPDGRIIKAKLNLKGIACVKPILQCHCVNPGKTGGNGENAIQCTFPNGKNAIDFTTINGERIKQVYCNTSGEACRPDQDNIIHPDHLNWLPGIIDANFNIPDNLQNLQFKGVSCGTTGLTDPTLPPAPSPPCKIFGSNGECQTTGTGLGDFSTKPELFIKTVFAILLSLSGGIALLLIMKAGYLMMTSQGKPEQLQAGRDQLIAAIVGLIFLIFSFVILQVIGFDILKLPGFG